MFREDFEFNLSLHFSSMLTFYPLFEIRSVTWQQHIRHDNYTLYTSLIQLLSGPGREILAPGTSPDSGPLIPN